jgi:hypothetical protein
MASRADWTLSGRSPRITFRFIPATWRRSRSCSGSIATTQVYLRKLDKATAMERVRDLSWGDVAAPVNGSEPGSSEIAAKTFESLAGVGAGGFEPP